MPFASQGAPMTAKCLDVLTPGSLKVRVNGLGLCRVGVDGSPITLPPVPIVITPETLPVRRILVEGVPAAVVGDAVAFHAVGAAGIIHAPLEGVPSTIVVTQTRVNIG